LRGVDRGGLTRRADKKGLIRGLDRGVDWGADFGEADWASASPDLARPGEV